MQPLRARLLHPLEPLFERRENTGSSRMLRCAEPGPRRRRVWVRSESFRSFCGWARRKSTQERSKGLDWPQRHRALPMVRRVRVVHLRILENSGQGLGAPRLDHYVVVSDHVEAGYLRGRCADQRAKFIGLVNDLRCVANVELERHEGTIAAVEPAEAHNEPWWLGADRGRECCCRHRREQAGECGTLREPENTIESAVFFPDAAQILQ
mmetsp:Transcript_48954/g.138266  ORF Transcript_48954/g.138266 Transcript_48954/m.138266 type:complete len:209 (+) Transcript_48954:3280-3906(+)